MKGIYSLLFCAVAFGLAVSSVCSGKTITVNAAGGADFTSIQAAISDLNTVDYDQIQVAPGTYSEAINFLGKAVRLYSNGGPGVTTLDANDLHYHVVQCISGEDHNTILEGFTLTGGNANGTSWPDYCGGGIFNYISSPTITNCIFFGNSASWGGGGLCNWGGNCSPTIIDCIFRENSAFDGGGLCNLYGCAPTVTGCIFNNNSASYGGGLCIIEGAPLIENCTFISNSADSEGGGLYNDLYGIPSVINCTFIRNIAAVSGGGIANNDRSSPILTNCTITNNSANKYGGGIYNFYLSNPEIANCILWGNTALSGPQIYVSDSSPLVTYSDVQSGWSGTGNINADPLLIDTPDGNLRLSRGSPCIDAGQNSSVFPFIKTDLNGWPRFIDDLCTSDTGAGTAPIVDMGAYEFLPADRNGSGFVNLPDYQVLSADWLQAGPALTGDLNCDNAVDLSDLAEQAAYWLAGGYTF